MQAENSGEIRLFFYGNLIRYRVSAEKQYLTVELIKAKDLAEALRQCSVPEQEVGFAVCNGARVPLTYSPKDGDEIKLYSLHSGG